MPQSRGYDNDDFVNRNELLAGKVLGNLSADEDSALSSNSLVSAEEQTLLKELSTIHSRLEQHVAPPLSDALRERLSHSARRHPALKPQHWLIGGLFLILAVTSGELYRSKLLLARLQSGHPLMALHPGDHALSMCATEAGEMQNVDGEVIIRPVHQGNLLTLNRLPQAPEGQLYRLWAVTPDGVKGCVHFLPDKVGNVVMMIPPQPTGSATQLLISLDPLSSLQSALAKPSQTVLAGAV